VKHREVELQWQSLAWAAFIGFCLGVGLGVLGFILLLIATA